MNTIPDTPPWLRNRPTSDWSLKPRLKKICLPSELKTSFYLVSSKYTDHTHLFTDGSKLGEKVGCAAIHKNISRKMRLPNHASIHTAELQAILLTVNMIRNSTNTKFLICSDSSSAIQSLTNHKVTNPLANSILNEFSSLNATGKEIVLMWIPSHVGISGNERADQKAKASLDLVISDVKIPYSDYRQLINKHFLQKWQTQWDNNFLNKLWKIKPQIGVTKLPNILNRKDQTVIHRMRLGHTRYTHSFLLRKEDCPICPTCKTMDSIEHILTNCKRHQIERSTFLHGTSLGEIFTQTNPKSLLAFAKAINLYEKI